MASSSQSNSISKSQSSRCFMESQIHVFRDSQPNHEGTVLTWENGQLAMHGRGGSLSTATKAKPTWPNQAKSSDTLESIVHQATQCNKKLNQNYHTSTNGLQAPGAYGLNHEGEAAMKKRERFDTNWYCGFQQEVHQLAHVEVPSTCASASATFDRDNDTAMMIWPSSYESPGSKKMGKTCNKDVDFEEQEIKGKTGQSRTRRSRVASIHNESERRRRDRINKRMRTLQKLVPNASKTDKASILDDVIEYLKQLQAQIQLMSMRTNMLPQLGAALGVHQPHHNFQMSLLAAAAAPMGMASTGGAFGLGVGMGMGMGGGFVPPPLPPPFMVAPVVQADQANKERNRSSSVALPDPYTAFLAQTVNMDLYNKMAGAIYRQHSNQTTQATSSTPTQSNHEQGDY